MEKENFSDYKTRPTELIGRKVRRVSQHNRDTIVDVERVTSTQIILKGGVKINYQGSKISDKADVWSRSSYYLVTDQEAAQIIQSNKDANEKYSLEKWLSGQKFTLEQLRSIKTLIEDEN